MELALIFEFLSPLLIEEGREQKGGGVHLIINFFARKS